MPSGCKPGVCGDPARATNGSCLVFYKTEGLRNRARTLFSRCTSAMGAWVVFRVWIDCSGQNSVASKLGGIFRAGPWKIARALKLAQQEKAAASFRRPDWKRWDDFVLKKRPSLRRPHKDGALGPLCVGAERGMSFSAVRTALQCHKGGGASNPSGLCACSLGGGGAGFPGKSFFLRPGPQCIGGTWG